MPERAARNRTITLTPQETDRCAALCPRAYTPGTMDTVLHGDAFDILPALPERFVDLLIVDPPYNLSKTYGGSAFKKMDGDSYAQFTRRWLQAVRHTLKDTASIYVCSDWRSSMIIGGLLEEQFVLQNRITWQREKGRGAQRNWKNAMEDIWFATVQPHDYTFHADAVKQRRRVLAPYRIHGAPKDWTDGAHGKYRDTFPSNFWDDISVPFWSMPENTDHPTQKPEKLLAKLILASSDPGSVVLDPFAGTGTTGVTAQKLGRRFLCIERERTYCALAQKRLEIARDHPAIQGYDDGVFWERNSRPGQSK